MTAIVLNDSVESEKMDGCVLVGMVILFQRVGYVRVGMTVYDGYSYVPLKVVSKKINIEGMTNNEDNNRISVAPETGATKHHTGKTRTYAE